MEERGEEKREYEGKEGGSKVEGGRWREGGGGREVEGGRWREGGGGRKVVEGGGGNGGREREGVHINMNR